MCLADCCKGSNHDGRRAPNCELPLFEPPTIEAIYQASTGLLRKANSIAHHTLFAAAIGKAKRVNTETSKPCFKKSPETIAHVGAGVLALVLRRFTFCRRIPTAERTAQTESPPRWGHDSAWRSRGEIA